MHDRDRYTALGNDMLITGDLFAEQDTIVIPIKTQGRTYGELSRRIAAQGVSIPDVPYEGAHWLERPARPNLVFVAFWNDSNENHDKARFAKHVIACTSACVQLATRQRVKRLAMPLLGGKHGQEALPAMALGVEQELDKLDDLETPDRELPEVVFLTNKTIASTGETDDA